ncbi:MAG: O-linked N-acetylglucosamine transferase family protein [Planctomycetota bacterium]|jgi:predicted O-linked N-acetylglucosamine transferase (SPINDLY family)
MSQSRKLKRSHNQKKRKKKQMMRKSSGPRRTSCENDEVQFTVLKDGRMRVTTSEENLPEFLIRARQAVQAGRTDEARGLINDDNIEIVRQMMEKNPSQMAVMYILAMTLVAIGRLDKAEEWYMNILRRKPHWAVYNELANIKEKLGRRSEEMEYRRKALEANPDNGVVLNNCGMHMVRMAQAQQGIEILRKAVEKAPGNPVVHSNFLLFMHYLSDTDRQSFLDEHKRWARIQGPTTLARTSYDNVPDPDRQLRIGYISPDFRKHSVAYFFEVLLDEQNRQAVETYGYSNTERPDEVTERLKLKFDHFQNIFGVSDKAVIEMIEKDKVDILVDLAGHTGNNRLPVLAHKPAPIQTSYLGYPDTSGMEQVDYRLTDELADPPDSQQFYTEELVYLPDGFLCYKPPDHAPPVAPLPALMNGYITFGSFNNNCKINPLIMSLWAEVLKLNDGSRLVLKFRGGDDKKLRDHYLHTFEQLGIHADRIDIHGPKHRVEHLKLYNQIDIALDTYPYNGTTTTFEALWMGVPVISLVGQHHMSRVALTILTRFGMGFLAAPTPQEYVTRATALAAKRQNLVEMRSIMRRTIAGASLCNTNRFVKNVEAAYREMWHRWCRDRSAQVTAEQITSEDQSCTADAEIRSVSSIEAAHKLLEHKTPRDSLEKPPVRIFHNLAQTGGTVVCKCLGCMNNIVLLSEIHPLGTAYLNPVIQAHNWHNLLTTEETRTLNARENIDFVDIIGLIETRCTETGRSLVIRDWGHLDFMAVPFLEQPSYRMLLAEVFAPAFDVIQIALVRHPVDQWLSLNKLALIQGKLTLEMFLRGYLRFAEHSVRIGFVRYEDFTAQPLWQMKIICEKLRLEFDEDFLQKWHDYDRITGDTERQSLGSKPGQIQLPRRPSVSPELLQRFRQNDDYRQALKLLNYPDIEEAKPFIHHPTISIDAAAVSSAEKPESYPLGFDI